MAQRFEGHFRGFDQTELFYQVWAPEKIRGVFVITHGLAEHSECYQTLAKTLCDDGWKVYAWDLRGHGRSEGKRGYVKHVSHYIEDLGQLHKKVRLQEKTENLLYFGHSMGGLVTIRALQEKRIEATALALSSPGLGLSMQVPKIKEMIANLAQRWVPTLTLHNEIKYEDLTHDPAMIESYRRDNLRHDKISPGLFLSMVESFPLAMEHVGDIQVPVLMQLSGEDRLVSANTAREFFERLPNKKNQLVTYPGSFHEIFNDLDRDKVTADLKKFINPFLGAS